jgi:plasmid stability protein
MPVLYVENIPDSLYKALRKRARENHKSIAAEVIALLERSIPTAEELRQRRDFYTRMTDLRAQYSESSGSFPTVEEMVREDRNR